MMAGGTEVMVEGLLEGLSEPQREAVIHPDGPLLILAGPGSGKTRVVTRRAAYLAATVVPPQHILAITFTNKAANEMRARIDALGGAEGMTVCTFHALCARLLRKHHDRAGVSRNFTIFDRDDRRRALKNAIAACDLSTDNWTPFSVEEIISNAKNDLQTAADFAETEADWTQRTVARIYAEYERLLGEMQALDFDDLLMRVAMLLERDGELRDQLEDRFQYVLVDEYQDTNAAQYAIARLLSKQRQNLCVTGDPDQSIYGWRGANIENILTFEQDYPSAKVVRLEQNYRSTKRILAAADRLIEVNVLRKEKTLWTDLDEGQPVRVLECEDAAEEATLVAADIGQHLRNDLTAGEIAVFYRVNSMSRTIEEALMRAGIAYQVAQGVEFYSRKEIKDVLAYLRVLVNPADEVSLLRIINTPARGIGVTTIRRLIEHARNAERRVYEVLIGDEDLAVLGRSATKVRNFGQLLRDLSAALEKPAPYALDYVLSHSGLRAMHHAGGPAGEDARANLDELRNAAALFEHHHPGGTILDWLEHTALISDVDTVRDEGGAVTLMTLHAAKGLEFAVVYIIGLEEGLLPFRRQEDECVDEEEERRLCFVGMTRARRFLTLSRARYRMFRGGLQRTTRSPFLDELPRAQVEWIETGARSGPGESRAGGGRLPDDIAEWGPGTLVRHEEHGLGQILALRRGGAWTYAEVQFQDGPRRTLALEFIKLERVDFDDVG